MWLYALEHLCAVHCHIPAESDVVKGHVTRHVGQNAEEVHVINPEERRVGGSSEQRWNEIARDQDGHATTVVEREEFPTVEESITHLPFSIPQDGHGVIVPDIAEDGPGLTLVHCAEPGRVHDAKSLNIDALFCF